MIKADLSQVKKLQKTLEVFNKKGIPHAARNALTATAYEARKEWVSQVGSHMVLRNTYTTRSIQYEKATGTNVSSMQSKVGSTLPYMETQELGGSKTKKGKHGVPIPTAVAAGQGMKARPRTKVVRKKNYLSAISVASRVGGVRQRRNAVAIVLAAKGSGVAYLDLGKRKGLFSVTGTKRGLKIRMLYDLSRATVTTPKNPTLEPTLQVIQPMLPGLHVKALIEQLKRAKVAGF